MMGLIAFLFAFPIALGVIMVWGMIQDHSAKARVSETPDEDPRTHE